MKFEIIIELPTTKRAWVIFFSRQAARLHSVLQQALVAYLDAEPDPEGIPDPLWPAPAPCMTKTAQTVIQVLYGPYCDLSAWCDCDQCQLRQASCS